ncbi:MAG: lytic murein transglycosylase B [Sedimenticola sp.]|nr:lytic murein transglycosylase B [Sedimenticola sp.]
MQRTFSIIGLLIILLSVATITEFAHAGTESDELIQELAAEKGYSAEDLRQILSTAKRSQLVIDSLNRPAETVHTWKTYRPIFLKPSRIEQGVAYWKKHQKTLEKAAETYGVAPEIIVAIIGVETFYGKRPGTIAILDALYTQAYHYPKRAKFGRSQLKAFLQILMEEQIEPAMAVGSYAGAMGTPQFIPTSFLSFAVDFDGDNKRDIWGNDADVIGSVANYFSKHQWRKGEAVAVKTKPLDQRHPLYVDSAQRAAKPDITVSRIKQAEIPADGLGNDNALIKVIHLKGAEGSEFWLGLHNFYVITRYNHSNLYAMAVFQLSQEILTLKNQMDKQ